MIISGARIVKTHVAVLRRQLAIQLTEVVIVHLGTMVLVASILAKTEIMDLIV